MSESGESKIGNNRMQRPDHRSAEQQFGEGEEASQRQIADEPEAPSQQMQNGSHHDHAWWGRPARVLPGGEGSIASDHSHEQLGEEERPNNLPHDLEEK